MDDVEKARADLRFTLRKTRTAEDEDIGEIQAELIADMIEALIDAKLRAEKR